MNKGTRAIICVIAITLIMIAENGIPVKPLKKWDFIIYVITFCVFISMSDAW